MIGNIVMDLREFFNTNRTKDLNFRLKQLKTLKQNIKHYEPEIFKALKEDLRKSDFEIVTTELGMIFQELDCAIKKFKKMGKN